MKSFASFFRRSPAPPGLIDVRQLIRQLTDAELLEAADGYFSKLTLESEQCHKPFSNTNDAIHITGNLSLLLRAANLFSHADVLDFGCATGWLTLALADMGAHAVGVDIAPSAVALAHEIMQRRGLRSGSSARFLAYDGQRLPLADESVDRVLCFDAFHHVKDQEHALREFARVLRPGGRVAMLEPGPHHSLTPQSQMEMARYKVIENDIVVGRIAAAGERVGLSRPQFLVQFQQPLTVALDVFEQWAAGPGLPPQDASNLLAQLQSQLTDTQCFFMTKGEAAVDSRRADALAADLQLLSARPAGDGGRTFELHFRIRNNGEAVWLTEPGRPGQVNLGGQLLGPDGTVRNLDHGRFMLGVDRLPPGAEIDLVVQVPGPSEPGSYLRFDLVSEQVAWFAQMGRCQPAEWRPSF